MFAHSTSSQYAKTIAKVIIIVFSKHAYLPTTIIYDNGSVFRSQVIKEVADVLGITLQHATTNMPPTINNLAKITNAPDVLEETKMIYQDVRKNPIHAYINYKAYYDKKTNASTLKQAEHVFVLQAGAEHQRSEFPFTVFWWTGPYFSEKVLPNNSYLVRKSGSEKTQVLRRIRLRRITTRQPLSDVRMTPRKRKPEAEIIMKKDYLYASACECE